MAQSFQQQSLQRKLIYFGVIVLLFFATLGVKARDVFGFRGITGRAEDLQLREKNQGEVRLTDSAFRLTLTGSRGLVVCGLWLVAQEKQKKNEWSELELVIDALTKLQPHFITPWRFHSWNLAYNVSVESDRIKDKYFYITRGIDLLADGERVNQDDPDLRRDVGYFYQDKMGMSDEANTLRSLLQMSCIDPLERDPRKLRPNPNERLKINEEALKDFCTKHPALVRRLYTSLGCKRPGDLVDFLEFNRKIPSRYEDKADNVARISTPLKPERDRFPILPPAPPGGDARMRPGLDEAELTNDSNLRDDFDNYAAARAWFGFAQEPLGPPWNRIPRYQPILFKGMPARAQVFIAERLEKEGWFDQRWPLREWFSEPVELGENPEEWAAKAWGDAFKMYEAYGAATGIYFKDKADEDKLTRAQRSQYQSRQRITNFSYFLARSDVEKEPEAIAARRLFYDAEAMRKQGDRTGMLEKFEDKGAFGPPDTWRDAKKRSGWTKIYYDRPKFRGLELVQEDAYELELKYLRAVQDVRGPEARRSQEACKAMAEAALAGRVPCWVGLLPLKPAEPRFPGPFDGVDSDGMPLIGEEAIAIIRSRLGLPGRTDLAAVPPPATFSGAPPAPSVQP